VKTAFGFGDAQLAALARNSFEACFAPEADKRAWQAEVDDWLGTRATPLFVSGFG
jgi:adenosine deaminase